MAFDLGIAEVVTSDFSTRGGEYLFIRSDAKATGSITTTEPTSKVVLRARGEQCEGAPAAEVLIDDTRVLSKRIASETWRSYRVDAPLPVGTHTVEIRFSNDRYHDSSCDRNLLVDQVSLSNRGATESGATEQLVFSDGFEGGVGTFDPPWSWMIRAWSDRLTTSSNVARKGDYSAKFTVNDEDVAPLTPTENPRAQVQKNDLFCEGDERYIATSVYFPNDFPRLPNGGWLIFASHGFREPWKGSAPGKFLVDSGDVLAYGRDENYGNDNVWTTNLARGEWTDLVVRVKFSTNPDVGFVEIWKNGQQQTLENGSTRMSYATLKPGQNGCGALHRSSYREKGMFEWATLYQDEVKVGSSYEAVAP